MRKNTLLTIPGGLGAAMLGLLYVNHAFGPTEAEVASWGQIAFYSGLAITLLSLIVRRAGRGTTTDPAAAAGPSVGDGVVNLLRPLLALAASALALLQIPPAILWFLFHNSGISDGSPPSAFVAHWAYAIPHILVGALCLGAVYQLFRRPVPDPV